MDSLWANVNISGYEHGLWLLLTSAEIAHFLGKTIMK